MQLLRASRMSANDWHGYEEEVLAQLQQQQRFEGRFALGIIFGLSMMAGLFMAIFAHMLSWIGKTFSL